MTRRLFARTGFPWLPPARFKWLTAAVLLAACGGGAPYSTGGPSPGVIGTVGSEYRLHQRGAVMICYDRRTTSRAVIQKMADDICAPYDRIAKYASTLHNQCSMSAPDLASFSCVPRPGENPPPIVIRDNPSRHEVPILPGP